MLKYCTYLFVLISGYCNELHFFEYICAEMTVWQLRQVPTSNNVEARLILVHRVENRLDKEMIHQRH